MTKKVLGVLAALAMVTGTAACSSSSTDPGTGPKPDTGTGTDTGTMPGDDAGKDIGVVEGGTDAEPPADKTTGKACMTDDDCDTGMGSGFAACTKGGYIIGDINPTAVCIQVDKSGGGADACEASDDKTIRFCDGNTGYCPAKTGTPPNPATCEAMCQMKADGTFDVKCEGKNKCNPDVFASNMDGSIEVIGICQGGCGTDADCATGQKCEPSLKYCVKSCTTDANCAAGWPTGKVPANWKCDTARGACHFVFTKTPGTACQKTVDDNNCLCLRGSAVTNGYCTTYCNVGEAGACPTGMTCGYPFPEKDDMGKALFSFTSQPAGLSGYCLKDCTMDADCGNPDMTCQTVPGLPKKACLTKPSTGDAG